MRRRGATRSGRRIEKAAPTARAPNTVDVARVVELLNRENDSRMRGGERLMSIQYGQGRIEERSGWKR